MKAIIMAGGEGTRLRPVSANKPKPMVELFDQPVLAYILELLRDNGVTEACLTLKYMPQAITDYFGSEYLGIKLQYRIETAPLGTAGGVLNCAEFIGSDDVIIISGDCVCDFDLKALMAFHREKKAEATVGLYSHGEPLEYGLVLTHADGRVACFTEKPAWDNVVTDQINTGIYVLSPSVLERIPAGTTYDFGRDLFPLLLKENRALYGCGLAGYWCDIGSVGAFLKCCQAALGGEIRLLRHIPEVKEGVRSLSDIPEGVRILPPVYIGKNVMLGRGATVGPGTVVGSSSVISSGAEISYSVVSGAYIGAGASLTGTVIGRDAAVGRGSVLGEGAAVGDRTVIGENCRIGAQTKIWPDKQIPDGAAVTGIIEHGMLKSGLVFNKPGVITGEAGITMTTEQCLRLGACACAAAGASRRVGVAWCGGDAVRVLCDAFCCGVNGAGGELMRHDGGFPACASFIGQYFNLPLSVFFEESDHTVSIFFYGQNGGKITRETERKFESAFDTAAVPSRVFGVSNNVTGVIEAQASAAVQSALTHRTKVTAGAAGLTVAVSGRSLAVRTLRRALRVLGCTVTGSNPGVIMFEALDGGRLLAATDEEGYRIAPDKLQLISAYIELSCGVSPLAVPADAPDAIDDLAGTFGAEIIRTGRDGARADALLAQQRVLCDAVFAAARIAAFLSDRHETLTGLRLRVPSFSAVSREIPVRSDRGAVMRSLASLYASLSTDTSSGLRMKTERGSVRISPLRDRSALRIRVESFSEELAEELCSEFEQRAHEADEK